MNFCVSGHENPTGAVYCVTCGKDLSLEAPASGRQCTLGHPMLSHEATCLNCGNLPVVEKMEAEIRKGNSNGKGIIAKLDLSDMQADARASIRKLQAKLKINLKITALILAIAIAIPSGYFGYTAFTGPNYKGKTIEEVFKNREDQISAVLQPTCSIGKSSISAAESDITYATEAIAADYHVALGSTFAYLSAGDVRDQIRDEVESQLKNILGDKYAKLDNASSVISNGEDSAITFCQLDGGIQSLREKSNVLEQTITSINAPGSWEGFDYYKDDDDPNIAWKYAARSAYPDGGWGVLVKSRLGCPGGVVVEMDATYGVYFGQSGGIAAGSERKVNVFSSYPSFAGSETGSVTHVTCLP